MEQLSLFSLISERIEEVADAVGQAVHQVVEKAKRHWSWPRLTVADFAGLSGEVTKFEANIHALETRAAILRGDAIQGDYRRILSRYTGWGGLPQVFAENPEGKWAERAEQARALLGDGWEAARASTLNAHYTAPWVVEAMWDAALRLGFRDGQILEPGAGTGLFAGFAPDEASGHFTLVELDPTTAKIATMLYQGGQARVVREGFEHVSIPDNSFALVIGNVPFGNYRLRGDCNRHGGFTIHNHFIAKSLALLAPGGIAMLITSSFTLDSKSAEHRKWFSGLANLVAAIRLPREAFRKIASTTVTTDILVFQKPVDRSLLEREPAWLRVEEGPHGGMVNRYFVEHPEMVVGELGMFDNGHDKSTGCTFDGDDAAMAEALRERIARLPEGIFDSFGNAVESGRVKVATGKPRYGYEVDEAGKLWVWDGWDAVPFRGNATLTARIAGMCAIRDAARTVLRKQAEGAADVEDARQALNDAYDGFVRKHGPVSAKVNRRAFRADPDAALVLALEYWDEENQVAEKAEIFVRNTHAEMEAVKVESIADAVMATEAMLGRLDVAHAASLLGMDEAQFIAQATEEKQMFADPESRMAWVSAGEYLSGDVRRKLEVAEAAGLAANVEALKAALPEDVKPEEIDVQIGATWLGAELYRTFFAEALGVPVLVSHDRLAGWSVSTTRYDYAKEREIGTDEVNVSRLLTATMNGKSIRVTRKAADGKRVVNTEATLAARERQEAVREAFREWLWKEPQRAERLAVRYNAKFNRFVDRKWDGSRLPLPGYSWSLAPRPHQLNGAARIVGLKNTLLAHVVGAGKTLTMILGAMEAKRLGLVSKPLFVVPNHMLYQFGAEFLRAYPNARLLLASKDDLSIESRKRFAAKIAMGAWDGIVMTHSSFERIAVSKEKQEAHVELVLDELREAAREARERLGKKSPTVKEMERAMKQWEARLGNLLDGKSKDGLIDFEELGVDALFVDEAHLFKNLWFHTQMERVAGLPSSNSQRAYDMLLKVRAVQEAGGKVVFATGTPVSNTMAEMWIMQHYLQPEVAGMFDEWAAQYGRVVTGVEVAPDGSGFRLNSRFAKFVNIPELMAAFRQVADIQTAQMLNLPVPKVDYRTEVEPPTEALKEYTQTLVERANAIRQGIVRPDEDNMLLVTMCGRKAALDGRLVGIQAGGKIARCAGNVVAEWEASRSRKGTQLVFCDLSTPGTGWFTVYDALRDSLVEMGIPKEEIAFIHDADTDVKKEALFEKVCNGDVRVLIGSTSKMGMGTNVQKRLVALHDLDAPWRPADMEQRHGRILRQGNESERVTIYRYVTEGSFDAYMWQTLEVKANFIAQVMGGANIRSMEDLEGGPLSYAEVKAIASGNPMVMEKVKADADVARYAVLRSRWQKQVAVARYEASIMPEQIARSEKRLASAVLLAGVVAAENPQDMPLVCKAGEIGDRKEMAKVIEAALKQLGPYRPVEIGSMGSFMLSVEMRARAGMAPAVEVIVAHQGSAGSFRVNAASTGAFTLRRILEGFEDATLAPDRIRESIASDKRRLEEYKQAVNAPFEYEEQWRDAVARQQEINRLLGLEEDTADINMNEAA